MTAELPRRVLAEVVGTAILVLFGAGSVVAALTLGETLDYAALGMVALTFAFAIAIAIYAFGATSGAHINPAVTLSLASVGRFPWKEVPPYLGAQLVGAAVGAALIVASFGEDAVDLGTGTTSLASGVSFAQGVVAEAVGTFLLVTAIMALAVDRRAPGGWAGLMIGLAVAAAILAIGPLSGGSLNPARTFGPSLVTAIGGGDAHWDDFAVYVIGPLLGGVLAAFSYDAIARPRAFEAQPAQGTQGDIEGRRDRVTEAGRRT
jgi:glycerol uptake facilitator protein